MKKLTTFHNLTYQEAYGIIHALACNELTDAQIEVIEVYSIAGEYDLIAKVRVEEYERLAEIVTQKIQKIPGIERTKTLMAFKTYKLE
jgi:DNA-binding Lrp family transcriptional regulator